MLVLESLEDAFDFDLFVDKERRIAFEVAGELLNLLLGRLQTLQACLVASPHIVEVESFLVVQSLVAIDVVLKQVRGDVQEVLRLEEVVLRETDCIHVDLQSDVKYLFTVEGGQVLRSAHSCISRWEEGLRHLSVALVGPVVKAYDSGAVDQLFVVTHPLS